MIKISTLAGLLVVAAAQFADRNVPHPICDGSRGSVTPVTGRMAIDGVAGCRRYTKGYDVTGTTNFVQQAVTDVCGCIALCVKNKATCAAWVWKYVDNAKAGGVPLRKCTLYSNFNLPPGSTLAISAAGSNLGNVGGPSPLSRDGFQQAGGFVPHCQMPPFDANGNGQGWDKNCFSGQLWLLDNPKAGTVGGSQAPSSYISC